MTEQQQEISNMVKELDKAFALAPPPKKMTNQQMAIHMTTELDKVYLSETEAKKLAQKLCACAGWNQFRVEFAETESQTMKGDCNWKERRIRLFGDGENVGTLLHEIAHIPNCGHGHDEKFWGSVLEITEKYFWLKSLEVQKTKLTVEELAAEMMSELETEIVSPAQIGMALLKEKMNNEENLEKMKAILKENGYRIIVAKKKEKTFRGITD